MNDSIAEMLTLLGAELGLSLGHIEIKDTGYYPLALKGSI
jgi:hypothetical protein